MPDNVDREMFFDAVREVAGQDAVERILRDRGGVRHALPVRAFTGNWLTEACGLENAQKIIDRVLTKNADGRVITIEIYFPLGGNAAREKLRSEAKRLYAQGVAGREVAKRLGVSERTAQRMNPNARTKAEVTAAKKNKVKFRRSKPRVGLLEELIISGASDSSISIKTGMNRKDIAKRRKTLKDFGLLKPSPDHSANVGGTVARDDEGSR